MLYSKRSLTALLIGMLFGISIVTHGFASTSASVNMAIEAATTGMSSPDDGMNCGGKDIDKRAACFALCATAIAILVDPAPLPVVAVWQQLTAGAVRDLPTRNNPPDPYPPRPSVLS